MYDAASADKIATVSIDATLTMDNGGHHKESHRQDICAFLTHCCRARHYSFQVTKCGVPLCTICKPVRMNFDVFSGLHFLPDPIPKVDGHYKSLEDVYGQRTTE